MENMCGGVPRVAHKELYTIIIKYNKKEYFTNVLLLVF